VRDMALVSHGQCLIKNPDLDKWINISGIYDDIYDGIYEKSSKRCNYPIYSGNSSILDNAYKS